MFEGGVGVVFYLGSAVLPGFGYIPTNPAMFSRAMVHDQVRGVDRSLFCRFLWRIVGGGAAGSLLAGAYSRFAFSFSCVIISYRVRFYC